MISAGFLADGTPRGRVLSCCGWFTGGPYVNKVMTLDLNTMLWTASALEAPSETAAFRTSNQSKPPF